jgi:hypothetical protein
MPADQDLLFGRIAVDLGFCTAAQVDACLAIQATSGRPMSLGHHLVQEGHLTEDQHSQVLERQRRNLGRPDPASRAPKEDVLFGRLVVREGLASQEQVNAALREQGRPGDRRTLGEVLLARGVLTREQVKQVLGMQSKWVMRCRRCSITLTVHSTSRNPSKVVCPRCKGPLEPESARMAPPATEAEIETSTRHPLPSRPKADPGGNCRVCNHNVVSMPASDGRVECLACRVRFVP